MHFAIHEKAVRTRTIWLKKVKRALKHKEPENPFLKTVKIFSVPLNIHIECKMTLDSGCDLNLMSATTLRELLMFGNMNQYHDDLCVCLNGGNLSSIGTITLRWKGKRFRKIFTTTFHIIDGDSLPWDVILGADTIVEHGILKFAGFGSRRIPVLPKKTKDEKNKESKRKSKHQEEITANDANVEADIRRREEAARQERTASGDSNRTGSSSSGSSMATMN
ncbi:hypothetical protein BKA65DRAFT_549643 [Rhexocercosporidium sp. MPI-PUGE-AT-0058]|nr:hypothetical protein BKA65DRAFT_549643 [Rhexocercosporidium sp. MPI-PUGE-AT-0058]